MKKLVVKIILLVVFLIPNITSAANINGLVSGVDYVEGEIIVKLKDDNKRNLSLHGEKSRSGDIEAFDRIKERYGDFDKHSFKSLGESKRLATFSTDKRHPFENHYKLSFPSNVNLEEVLNNFNNDESVEYAHLNYIAKLYDGVQPNDPDFSLQWGLSKIKAPNAWNINKGSEDIIIAVVDTGIDYNHVDLGANMWDGSSCVDENDIEIIDGCAFHGHDFADGNNNPMDIPEEIYGSGHGTHVAGIVSAVTNNEIGVAGVSWNSKLMAVKIFKDAGGSASSVEIAAAIRFAANNGAHIISNSWGYKYDNGDPYPLPPDIVSAINYANGKGSLVVFAAGNENKEAGVEAAQTYNEVITVAMTNLSDQKAILSNYGDWIDVSAPGTSIYSTVPDDKYGNKSGTSMATPFVSGLAALIWSQDNTLSREDVWDIIVDTADDINDDRMGSGRINAYEALKEFVSRVNFTIKDEEDDFIEGVSLIIYGDEEKNEVLYELETNENGEIFVYLEDGEYWFAVSKEEYYTYEGNFIVSKGTVDIELTMIIIPYFEVDDFSSQLEDKQAGEDYGTINITLRKGKESDIEKVDVSFLVKERTSDEVAVNLSQEEVEVSDEGDTEVNFELGVLTIADIYDVVFTITAEGIDDIVKEHSFLVYSAEVVSFDAEVDETETNIDIIIEIKNAKDEFENLLGGEYGAEIRVLDTEEGVVYSNIDATVVLEGGEAEYVITDGIEEDGDYTVFVKINEVEESAALKVLYVEVSEIVINEEDQELVSGGTLELTYSISPSNATNKNVFWSSEDEDVAVVSGEGVVTAVGDSGIVEILVTTECGEHTDNIIITVIPALYTVTFSEQNNLGAVQITVYSNISRTELVGTIKETNSSGIVAKDLEDGEYWFTAAKAGYNNYNGNFTVNGEGKTVTFTLTQRMPGGGGGSGGGSRDRDEQPSSSTDNGQEEITQPTTEEVASSLSTDEYKEKEKSLTERVNNLKSNKDRINRIKTRSENVFQLIVGHEKEEELRELINDILSEASDMEERINSELAEKEEELKEVQRVVNLINQKERLSGFEERLNNFINIIKDDSSKEEAKNALEMLLREVLEMKERIVF